jgi:Domain of unknown function (DUF4112)
MKLKPAAFAHFLDPEIEAAYARIAHLSRLMDAIVAIPGTNIRIGFDALLGLAPVIGDILSQVISTYIIWEARQLGVSGLTLARMIANSLIDATVGSIPIAGDAFDIAFRANMKNLRLLRQHLEKTHPRAAVAGRVGVTEYERAA